MRRGARRRRASPGGAGRPAASRRRRPAPRPVSPPCGAPGGSLRAPGVLRAALRERSRRPGTRNDDHGGGPVNVRRKDGGGARLVVILQKVQRSIAERRRGPEVLAHGARRPGAQPVVEPLVIGEVETLLLQRPLEVPVNLGDEEELRVPPTNAGDGLGPERAVDGRRPVARPSPVAPGAGDDLGLEQHGHVAADAVGALGDPLQLGEHRLPKPAVPVVELERVVPAEEVRIAAVREDPSPPGRLQRHVVLRLAAKVVLVPCDEELRMGVDPGVIERDVVGDEVDQQAEVAAVHSLPQTGQRRHHRRSRDERRSRRSRTASRRCRRRGGRAGRVAGRPGSAGARAPCCPARPVCQTPSIQSQPEPRAAARSSRSSGRSSSVVGRARAAAISLTSIRAV